MDFEKYIESLKTRIGDERLFFDYQLEPPEVSSILKLKGTLRISWAFDMKYNKQIDLIFFPEDNPYLNYAVLYAKDFKKGKGDDARFAREINNIDIPYNINYDFVKEILSQSNLTQDIQDRFFNSRFGSVYINIEVEFEWWILSAAFEYTDMKMLFPKHSKDTSFSFLAYESSILRASEDLGIMSAIICLGTIKSYKSLPLSVKLDFPPHIATWDRSTLYHIPYAQALAPLPTSTLATTYTNINDFIINVRDKPNTKDSTIITQLLTQKIKMPDDFMVDASKYDYDEVSMVDYSSNKALNPIYNEMVNLGMAWFKADDLGYGTDIIGYFLYYQHKSKQNYFNKEKHKLINPLKDSDYMILVWNIESNNWAKVWILKYQKSNNNISLEQDLSQNKQDISNNLSKLKLYEGYIHCSGLRYLMPFGENYIKK